MLKTLLVQRSGVNIKREQCTKKKLKMVLTVTLTKPGKEWRKKCLYMCQLRHIEHYHSNASNIIIAAFSMKEALRQKERKRK